MASARCPALTAPRSGNLQLSTSCISTYIRLELVKDNLSTRLYFDRCRIWRPFHAEIFSGVPFCRSNQARVRAGQPSPTRHQSFACVRTFNRPAGHAEAPTATHASARAPLARRSGPEDRIKGRRGTLTMAQQQPGQDAPGKSEGRKDGEDRAVMTHDAVEKREGRRPDDDADQGVDQHRPWWPRPRRAGRDARSRPAARRSSRSRPSRAGRSRAPERRPASRPATGGRDTGDRDTEARRRSRSGPGRGSRRSGRPPIPRRAGRTPRRIASQLRPRPRRTATIPRRRRATRRRRPTRRAASPKTGNRGRRGRSASASETPGVA